MNKDAQNLYPEEFQDLEVSFSRVQEARDEDQGDDEREFMQDVVNELNDLLRGKDKATRLDVVAQFCRYLATEADYIEQELVDEMLAQVGVSRSEMDAATIDDATCPASAAGKRPRL